ncbi:MAG: membrane protein insertase YidC [Proteobacteria bacterium]|nr:membrane protein insertase YidC [Pseudomonadota bacterium]
MPDQKNLVVAIVLSLVILLGFQYFYELPRMRAQQDAQQVQQAAQQAQQALQAPRPGATGAGVPTIPGAAVEPAAPAKADRAAIVAQSPRVRIQSARVTGSIALEGGRIDDVTLATYRRTTDPQSPPITLLNPAGTFNAAGTPEGYYVESGWVPEDRETAVPDDKTRWTADRTTLTPEQPVTLTWDNGQGLRFTRQYALDRDFMFTVTSRVDNATGRPVTLLPFALIARNGTPVTEGFYILHEGPIAVLNDVLREVDYSKVEKAKDGTIAESSTGGWIGITDKYWLVSLIPDSKEEIKTRFVHTKPENHDRYQADYLGAARQVAAGGTTTTTHRVFAGAKEVQLLGRYRDELGIAKFDDAVDWGWFHFLTKPIFQALDWIYGRVGNFGIAILILTVVVKALFFPLANRSYVMMSRMKALTPEMTAMRERFGDDRQRLNQEMMALYKKHQVNPVSGCFPVVLQIPVFFSLYKVLFVTIEMRHAPFYGWIHDLSAHDPTTVLNLFGLIPFTAPHILDPISIGAWPIIMGITMFLQQKLNPQPADPVQAKVFMFMPIIFTFMLGQFAVGLVIYWSWNNLLSMAQQWVIMKRTARATATAKVK